jgi:hypothetical protein
MQGPDEDRRALPDEDLQAPHVGALGAQGQHFPPRFREWNYPSGSSTDEDFNEWEWDNYYDNCVWEYVPEYTTEPARSRAMAEYGFMPLVQRHRYVGRSTCRRHEVERLQEEESDRKLIAELYPWLPQ